MNKNLHNLKSVKEAQRHHRATTTPQPLNQPPLSPTAWCIRHPSPTTILPNFSKHHQSSRYCFTWSAINIQRFFFYSTLLFCSFISYRARSIRFPSSTGTSWLASQDASKEVKKRGSGARLPCSRGNYAYENVRRRFELVPIFDDIKSIG